MVMGVCRVRIEGKFNIEQAAAIGLADIADAAVHLFGDGFADAKAQAGAAFSLRDPLNKFQFEDCLELS